MTNTDSAAETTEESAMDNLDKLSFSQLQELSRAAEAKASVLRSKALQFPDRYQAALDEANAQLTAVGDRLRDIGGAEGITLQDREGTAPTYSDKFGAYAKDVDVANLGGVGIDFSNTNPDLARQVMAGEVTLEEARETVGEPPPVTPATTPSSVQPISGEPAAPAA